MIGGISEPLFEIGFLEWSAAGDAVREITQDDPTARVLMCSAMGQQALVVEAIQAGAKDFVVKPFQPDRILDAAAKAVA